MGDRNVTISVSLISAQNALTPALQQARQEAERLQQTLRAPLGNVASVTAMREPLIPQNLVSVVKQPAEPTPPAPNEERGGFARGMRLHRILHHGVHSVAHAAGTPELGMVASMASLGPAAGAAGVAIMSLTAAVHSLSEVAKRTRMTIEEASQIGAAVQSGGQSLERGSRLRREELERILLQTPGGSYTLSALARAQERGDTRAVQSITQHALAQAERDFARANRPGLAADRYELAGYLRGSNNSTGTNVQLAHEREARIRAVGRGNLPFDLDFGHRWWGMSGMLGERMSPDAARAWSDVTTLVGRNAQAAAGAYRNILQHGLASLNPFAGQHEGRIEAGRSGDFADLYSILSQAALQGEQRNWQDEVLTATKAITTALHDGSANVNVIH